MKHLPLLLLLAVSFTARSQNNTQTITLNGIGDIKLGMKKADLEKLTGQTLKLVNLMKKDAYDRDTFNFTYKAIPYQVILDKDYINDKKDDIIIYEVRSNSNLLKTKSGVGIGDDKLKIVTTYDGYLVHLQPEYENNYTVKSKTKSSVWVFDDDGKVLVFYLTNNKITGFSVMYNEGC